MSKMMKKLSAIVMAFVVAFGLMSATTGATQVEAAKKVSISSKTKTLEQKKSFTLQLKNAKGKISWSVSNANVATIKPSGKKCKVTAVTGGKATVSAKVGKKTYKCKVTVKGLNTKSVTINNGKSVKIKAVNLGNNVKWSVSNKKVATVKGKKATCTVKAVKAGTVTVTAKVGKKKYTAKVIVSAPVQSAQNLTVEEGKAVTVSLAGVTNGTAVTWSVTNGAILKGKNAGATAYQVTGAKAGTAYVKAVVNGQTYTWTITVKAKPVQKPADPKPVDPKPVDPSKDDNMENGSANTEKGWEILF